MTWRTRLWLLYASAVVVPLLALTYLATVYVQRRVEKNEATSRLQTLDFFSRGLDDHAERARFSLNRLAQYLERPAAGPFVEASLAGQASSVPWSHILWLLPLDPMPERLRLVDPLAKRAVSFVELDGRAVATATRGADTTSVVTAITAVPSEAEVGAWQSIANAGNAAWVRYLPDDRLEMGVRFLSAPKTPEVPRTRRRRAAPLPPSESVVRFIVADFKWADFLWPSVPRDGRADYFVAEPASGTLLFRARGLDTSIAPGGPRTLAELETPGTEVLSTMVQNLGVTAVIRSEVDPTLAQRTTLIWVCVGALLAIIAIGVATVARDLTQGLREIEAGISAYGAGRFTHRVPLWSRDEIGRAGRSLNAMAQQLDRSQRLVSVAARQDVMRKLRRRIGREVQDVSAAMTNLGKQLQSDAVPRALLRGAGEVTLRLAERVRAIEAEFPEVAGEDAWRGDEPVETIEIAVLIDEAIATSRALAKPNVDVRRVVPPSLPPVQLPRAPLAATFRAILDNALRAMPKGGTVKIEATAHTAFVQVVFIDAGCGMSAEFVNNELFQAFSSGWANEEGLGLSLHRARQFVRAFGGEIEAASHDGVGTRVTVRLPLPKTPRRGETEVSTEGLGNPPSMAQN